MSVAELALSNQVNAKQLHRSAWLHGRQTPGCDATVESLPESVVAQSEPSPLSSDNAAVAIEIESADAIGRVRHDAALTLPRRVLACVRSAAPWTAGRATIGCGSLPAIPT